jgi:hypothetical protein
MAYDEDVYLAAKLVTERYDANAARWASQRVSECQAERDVIGVGLWLAIKGAIEELQRQPKRRRVG